MPDQTSFEAVFSCASEDRPIPETLVKALAERSIVSQGQRHNRNRDSPGGRYCQADRGVAAAVTQSRPAGHLDWRAASGR